jgi:uncharacterized protein (DUF427 family)
MARQLWKFEPTEKRIRAILNNEVIGDSSRAMLMIESPGELNYYFPIEDLQMDLLLESDYTKKSGYRGTKRFWHVKAGEQVIKNAAWTYDPKDNRPDFLGYLAINWQAMDHWYEEEEEVFYHPRNPYHRVDTIKSSRHVEVYFDGEKIADTKQPYLLFETSLPTRYYIPVDDVRMDYLKASDTHSICPYKGNASYYSVGVNDAELKDVVWTYPDPIPEAPKVKNLLAFWSEKDKRIQIFVDGIEK